MESETLAAIFGTFAALATLFFGAVQLGGARMAKYTALAAFLFTSVISLWSILVTPLTFELGNVWKFGMLYGILFVILFLERMARKEEAEERLKEIPGMLQAAKKKGFVRGKKIAESIAWQDRKARHETSIKLDANTKAVRALRSLYAEDEKAKNIIKVMDNEIAAADQASLLLVAKEIQDSGILVKHEVAQQIKTSKLKPNPVSP